MTDTGKYLTMQREQYDRHSQKWSLDNRSAVVGSYEKHNAWPDYDTYLFKDLDTQSLVALEYGCGPARNLIKFNGRFQRIDGVDISQGVLDKAKINLKHEEIVGNRLLLCDGASIPAPDNTYDVVFSVICLQHIAVYDIRFSIFKEIHRVLKPGGSFCFQMGYGGKSSEAKIVQYYDNAVDTPQTNGTCDVVILSEQPVIDDLNNKLGFRDYESDIRPTGPGDNHANWIWIRAKK